MHANTREMIRKFDIRLTKSLGQNFLIDENVVRRIADSAEVTLDDLVIEVGPGIGGMTRELAARAGHVTAIEIDRRLIPALEDNLRTCVNVDIVNKDVMELDVRSLAEKKKHYGLINAKVAANLPYYITTPIIMKFLEEDAGLESMVFMVQKEVADRMVAKPGGKEYGSLSVAVQFYSRPEKMFDVSPHCFIPQPEVDSTVIRLTVHKEPPVELCSRDLFFKTVKASFGQRRKTLVNALFNSGYFMKNKEEIKEILKNIGIEENQRGETLSVLQFAQLSNAFFTKKC